MDLIKLYFQFAKVNFLTQMEYRMDYFFRMIAKIFSWSTGFIMISILLYKFKAIGGWNTYEVMFLYALDVLSYSIAATFFMGPCENLATSIHSGQFDEVLTRPVNSLCYYVCRKVSAGYVSNYVISIIIIVICFTNLHISLSIFKFFMLIVVILGASLIQGAAFLITTIPSFWLIKSKSLYALFYSNLTNFLQYPLNIYKKSIQIFLTFILPYGFINFYPAQYFLGKDDVLFHPAFQFLTPIVGIFLFTIACFFWEFAINHYKSTGS